MLNYSCPDLIDTHWLTEHLNDPSVRVIEANMNPEACKNAHIPGAVFWNIFSDLMKPDLSLNLDSKAILKLLSRSGILPQTTVVAYGSNPATGAVIFWFLKRFGHQRVYVLNGGYQKWIAESRPLTSELTSFKPTQYTASSSGDRDYRIVLSEVQNALDRADVVMLDVRTPSEYRGDVFIDKPPTKEERSGHIPGAVHLEHILVLNKDGTFKSAEELQNLFTQRGITKDKEIIPYCAIGLRSGFIWFVLKYLLSYPNVRNYDGSWNEWSRLPNLAIE